ncbi:DUF4158 domain-containing protein, partial [Ralstonia insidiosa]
MQGWHTTFLGMRGLPRDISDFEMKAFFTFDGAERDAINARRGDSHKLGLALHIGFLRMSGRLLGAFRVIPVLVRARQWLYKNKLVIVHERAIRTLIAAALAQLEVETGTAIAA